MKIHYCKSTQDYTDWEKGKKAEGFSENQKWQLKQVKHYVGQDTFDCDRHQFFKQHKFDAWRFFHGLAAFLATVLSFGIAYKKSTTIRGWFEGKEVIYVDIAKANPTVQKVKTTANAKQVTPPEVKKHPAPINPQQLDQLWNDLHTETHKMLSSLETIPSNQVRMRFLDVRCPQETAVSVDGGYLHANKVTMPDGKTYIASQAPMKGNEECWWRGVLQEAELIVDLSSKKDRSEFKLDNEGNNVIGKDGNPVRLHSNSFVQIYYPAEVGVTKKFGDLKIKCTAQHTTYKKMEGLTLSTYEITDGDGKPKTIQRLHYDGWADYGATATEHMRQLTKIVNALNSSKPLFIHCRAGVGRTGTFITAMSNENLISRNVITPENALDQTKEAILRGRKGRSSLFVQTKEQLASLILFNQHCLQKE